MHRSKRNLSNSNWMFEFWMNLLHLNFQWIEVLPKACLKIWKNWGTFGKKLLTPLNTWIPLALWFLTSLCLGHGVGRRGPILSFRHLSFEPPPTEVRYPSYTWVGWGNSSEVPFPRTQPKNPSPGWSSNLRPYGYKPCALTNWAKSATKTQPTSTNKY